MITKIKNIIFAHKIVAITAIILLVGGGYFWYRSAHNNGAETSYVETAVAKGTIISSVSGTGQVSASNEVAIKTEASGKVTYLGIKAGQEVAANAVIAQIDATDAYKSVKDAETSLESTQLALAKLKEPADATSVLQAENALTSAQNTLEKLKLSQEQDYQNALSSKQSAEDDLDKAYEDSFNAIADTFLDLPTTITKLNDILYSTEISKSEPSVGAGINNIGALTNVISNLDDRISINSYQQKAESDYQAARDKYDDVFNSYKSLSRNSDRYIIENLLSETLSTTKLIAEAAKSESNYLDAWADLMSKRRLTVFSKVTTYQSNLSTYIGETNSHISSLLSCQTTIKNDTEAIANTDDNIKELEQNNPLDLAAAEASVKEKEASLADLKAAPDKYELRTQELAVKQKEIALADARASLADYTVRAPFAGVIATVDIAQGDTVAANGSAATIITKQSIAEVSFNEIDAAKIKVGQKATITFDALEGLSITGQVAEIDTLGAVSSGVVSYGVKITFDVQDGRIKPGMSMSATIVIDSKQDILTVPLSAVKTSGSTSYVEILANNQPQQQEVVTGLSNDTSIEIVSGLNEGDKIITQTISGSSSSATSNSTSNSNRNSMRGVMQLNGGGGPPD